MYNKVKYSVAALILLPVMLFAGSAPKKTTKPQLPLENTKEGLVYGADSLGNRIPDFSYSGYMAGEQAIPNVFAKVVVPAKTGDATARIQAAIDYVSSLKPDKSGFRGAILLQPGVFEIDGQLIIRTSGVVLRGSGIGENGTKLVATGKDRRTLIRVVGKDDRTKAEALKVADAYVPVNAMKLTLKNGGSLKAGDKIMVRRPSTQNWIEALGTVTFGGGVSALGWKPGDRDIYWDRTVVAINGNEITLDAPITTALDANYGGGEVIPYTWNGRISQVGVENMQCTSTVDAANPKDEAHAWMAITLENVIDGWVRQITFSHFAGSAVMALETSRRLTVEDCISTDPVSELGGQRRYTFFNAGQQSLFQRLYAEGGNHDFGIGFCAAGPNAFVQCQSVLPYSFSGAIDSWASGVLFDIVNVDGNNLRFSNRQQDNRGTGWSAANSVFYQCSASLIDCPKPPTAQNWAFGCWSQFGGDGGWYDSNNQINPRSLYYAQLAQRLGKETGERSFLMLNPTEASSSPSVKVAQQLTQEAQKPAPLLQEWIKNASSRTPIITEGKGLKSIDEIGVPAPKKTITQSTAVINGKLVHGDQLLAGMQHNTPWWNGSLLPTFLDEAKPALTRFVPGRTGTGLTDDVNEVAEWMKKSNIVSFEQHYGLWTDRRRDDHERIRRIDGDVWAPFYEQPFARSGQGTAWDGLSKYDLTKYNTWYWLRLKQFADFADQNGLVLLNNNFFQHNIIEAGAHWVDCPWRTANNINSTGFPEPVNFAGDKRLFFAEMFYDTTNVVRKELYKKYIRQCLNNFTENSSVIQLTSDEYTGPLHFMQFWLDVIAAWEKETGKHPLIGLSATKDVQDAILKDPKRAAVVDVIDIRYWHYRDNGTVYAPQGGLNLAPRQHARLVKPGKSSFEQVYRAVNEYRTQCPDKAVMYYGDSYPAYGWAVLMAGGSLPNLPAGLEKDFLKEAAQMSVLKSQSETQYILGNPGKGYIVYSKNGEATLDLSANTKTYVAKWINPATGVSTPAGKVKGGKTMTLKAPKSGTTVLWLSAK
ncbi:DUF6298 domain-containing protein [Paludibacter sp.]|uniref:DUF6298 domain-containing protein n=1 Tax=Paludibacter sp. TaxID=1898105 RepID=UPI0025E84FA8|nr:DUF6298 domain-containing protein [Paludibacter sp.]